MVIALVVAVVLGVVAAVLGGLTLLALLRLRSTVDHDRASVAQSLQRLRAALETALGRINEQAVQLTAIGAELTGVGEASLRAQRRINEHAAELTAIGAELAAVGETSLRLQRTAHKVPDAVAPRPAPPPATVEMGDDDVEGKVLLFRKPKKQEPRVPEPIEDPPSGESERIETLADVIRLTAHTLPTGSRDAIVKAIASMFRENPKADMDTDSGPLWFETIDHFLRVDLHVPIPEINAEYNRRAEEYDRRLDEEEIERSPAASKAQQGEEGAPISGTIGPGPSSGPSAS